MEFCFQDFVGTLGISILCLCCYLQTVRGADLCCLIFFIDKNCTCTYYFLFSVYFPPQQPMYTQTQQRPVMTQPPQGYQKRTKKVLAITDPNTGKNIMDDIMPTAAPAHSTTPPHSGSNSSRATPVGVSADVSSFFAH